MKIFQKGFTLVEILVVIGIIAVLLAAAVPSFNKYNRVNEFHQVAQSLKSAIETTKNYTLSPRIEKTDGEDVYGIIISSLGDGFQYQIFEGDPQNIIESRKFLEDNIEIIEPSGPEIKIEFSISEKGKIVFPDLDQIKMRLTNSNVPAPDNSIDLTIFKETGRVEVYETK